MDFTPLPTVGHFERRCLRAVFGDRPRDGFSSESSGTAHSGFVFAAYASPNSG